MDSGEPNKLFYGRRLAALLGAVALLREDAVEVHTLADGASADGGSFDSGSDVLGAMVDELERLPAGRTTDLRESIRRAATSGWQPEIAVLISDGLVPREELAAAALELARSARSATVVQVTDPVGMVADWAGSTLLLDSETGQRIDATITPEVWQRYAESYARLSEEIARQCRANGVRYVKADTSVDPLEFLIARAREQSLAANGAGRLTLAGAQAARVEVRAAPERDSIRPATPTRKATSASSASSRHSECSLLPSAPRSSAPTIRPPDCATSWAIGETCTLTGEYSAG